MGPSKGTSLNDQWTAAQLKSPVLAVDAVIQLEDNRIVLVRRRNPPFQGWWALPGGACEIGESVQEALNREVKEETGLEVKTIRLIGVFSDPHRDPRGHTVSIAFLVHPIGGALHAGSDAEDVQTFHQPPSKLAFDHRLILEAANIL